MLLIVNADDFGISEGVNRGIVEAHRRGILTSTTLMANLPAFDHAASLRAEHPTLGVGIHLNLAAGTPVLPPSRVPTLLDENGRFLRGGRLLRQLNLGRLNSRQIEAELSAQVERALRAGFSPTHLDSHHHLHIHPVVQPIAIRLALRHGIAGIRCTVELSPGEMVRKAGMLMGGTRRALYAKAVVLSVLGKLLQLRARRAGLSAPDHFRGLLLGLAFSAEELHEVLRGLPAGSTELMCHPGYADDELRRLSSYTSGRESELRSLLDPANRVILDQIGARPGNYSDL